MNALDILVIGVIVLSGLFAFARGFVKEALSIAGWLGATAAAIYAMPYARPFAQRFLPAGAVADAVAAGVVFIVTLIVLSIITSKIARRVKRSSLSAVDRTLGLIFGLARGVLLVALGSVALFYVLPRAGDRPRWITESRTLPLVQSATDSLAQFLPASLRKKAAASSGTLESDYLSVLRAYSVPGSHPGAAAPGIAPDDRQRLNQLIQQIGSSPGAPQPPAQPIRAPAPGQ